MQTEMYLARTNTITNPVTKDTEKMKKLIYITFAFMAFPFLVKAQDTDKNYIKTTTYQEPYSQSQVENGGIHENHKIENTSYHDGLGRPLQNVSQRSGGNKEDLVTPITYDEYGREAKTYLPYPANGNGAGYVTDPFTPQHSFYLNTFPEDRDTGTNTINGYSETRFEASPLNRTEEEGAPGNDWKVDHYNHTDHTIKYDYETNGINEVHFFTISFNGGNTETPSLSYNGHYTANKLYKNIVKDENWTASSSNSHATIEFTDHFGQTVLKRAWNNGQAHDTYYVYDDFDNLTYVLSPEASAQIVSNGALVPQWQAILNLYGYQYKYDSRNRPIEKKVPGKGWEYIVYNKLDQPILTQDVNQRSSNEWSFTKYDKFGRDILTGILPSAESRTTLQGWANNQSEPFEHRVSSPSITSEGDSYYYSNDKFPNPANLEIHTISYYDSYVDHSPTTLPTSVLGQAVTTKTKGLSTVNKVRALGTSVWATTLTAYDTKGQVIYVDSHSHYLDSRDITKSLLDFTGKVLESETQHLKTGKPNIITHDYFTYDHVGRLLTHRQQIDNEMVQLIADNTYDALGQLVQKGVGGNSLLDGYTDLTQVDVDPDGTITSTAPGSGWQAQIKTQGAIPSGFDGYIEATVGQNDKHLRLGFVEPGHTNWGGGDYDYAIHARANQLVNYWNPAGSGSWAQAAIPSYSTGDLFRVERVTVGSTHYIKYWHNNNNFFTYTLAAGEEDTALVGKVSFDTNGAEASNINMDGPLLDKKLQRVDYAYNIRGWLTDINDIAAASAGSKGFSQYSDLFNFHIDYNNVSGGTGATPLYNGSISQTLWKTENDSKDVRSYSYIYDDLNRVVTATGHKGSNLNGMSGYDHHDLSNITYDRNGNLASLKRRGANGTDTASGIWDDLTYEYSGNQLLNVQDNASDPTYNAEGFKDGNVLGVTTDDDYDYDANGNMFRDRNKGITSITYNHLNLPETVTIDNGTESGTIIYTYDATGDKLKKTVAITGQATKEILYAGGYVYEDNELQFFANPEGYVEPVAGTSKSIGFSVGGATSYTAYNYVFQYRDHLGNVRLSYTDSDGNNAIDAATEIVEESNYYPFGLRQAGYNNSSNGLGNSLAQQWKFGGKQLQEEFGLQWYDISARNYDPALGRWFVVDALADAAGQVHNSPYNYALNDPIALSDPDGNCPFGLNCQTLVQMAQMARNYYVGIGNGYSKQMDQNIDGFMAMTDRPASQYISEAFSAHIDRFTTPVGAFETGREIITMGGYNPATTFVDNAVVSYYSDDPVTAFGEGVGANLANQTVDGAGVLLGAFTGRAFSMLKASRRGASRSASGQLASEVEGVSNNIIASGNAPATVVGAELNGTSVIATSGQIPTRIAPSLQRASSRLGGVGATNSGNTIGCCGEFRAANQLLLQNPSALPTQVNFTPALRPRTGGVIKPCDNCVGIFGLDY